MTSYHKLLSEIKKGTFKVISLDLFDTLVLRLVDHPHQIFDEIGKKAIKSNLLHSSITADEFALLRIKAEQDARKVNLNRNGHNEVNLEEIYEFLPQFIGDRTVQYFNPWKL